MKNTYAYISYKSIQTIQLKNIKNTQYIDIFRLINILSI